MLKIILSLFLFFSLLNASEISNLISKIKIAKQSNKRLLINQLKVLMRNSNKKTRTKIISKLRISHKNKQNSKNYNHINKKIKMHKNRNKSSNFYKNHKNSRK
jgi:hypothetical protein